MSTEQYKYLQLLAEVFTPTQPIALPDLLSGRRELVNRLMMDIFAPSQHVLLYGDRGVGKTSIARVLAVLAEEANGVNGRCSYMVSCASNDTYASIWRKVFREIRVAERAIGFQTTGQKGTTRSLEPPNSFDSPDEARLLLQRLQNPTTIIIDEFDRVQSDDAKLLMTDTIKLFSDNYVPCSIVLVGVGQSIEQLIAAHESISRNVDYVQVPLLTPEYLAQIIKRGMAHAGLTYDDGLDASVATLSQGYPHYTHLLGLSCGSQATNRKSTHVSIQDLESAIPISIERVSSGLRLEYDKATDSTQPNNLFKEVLLACALVDKDVRGRFPSIALQESLQRILRRDSIPPSTYQRHLALFCEPERGGVLVRTGRPKNYRWHFSNPQLIPFIHLQSIDDGLIRDGLGGR